MLYKKGQAAPQEFVLNLNDKFVQSVQVATNNSNNLSLFGLYKTKYDGYITGYFIATLNEADGKISTSKMEAFPDELVTQIKVDKQGSDKEKDPGLSAFFYLSDMIDRADGSKDYLLEYYRKEIRTSYNASTHTTTTYPYYTYGDILDLHMKGDKTMITRIPKWQATAYTSMYSGFKATTVNNKLLMFYNDERDNVERDLAKRPDDITNFGKSVLAMAVIDAKDNLVRSTIYDHREMKLTTAVNVSQKLGNDKIGLYAVRNAGLFSSAKDMVGILEVN